MAINNKLAKGIATIGTIAVIYISAHLSLKEATVTSTGISNIPDSVVLVNMSETANQVYEPCYNHFHCKIYISSFFRNKEVNQKVGGALHSSHVKGEAMDLCPRYYCNVTNKQLYEFIRDSIQFDQLIMEGGKNGWIHVSYRKGKNRHQYFSIPNP
jgi:zinc D-Ala-D-Ala carboxypeptidase